MAELDVGKRQRLRDELPRIYGRVLARAVGFANDKRVLAVLGGDPGKAAEDLVQEAVVRTLGGQRNWDPSTVELEHFLVQAVRSIADSYKRRGSYRGPTYEDELAGTVMGNPGIGSESFPTPEAALEAKQAEEALENELIQAAGDDDDLLHIVEALLSGADRPREIAQELKWDVTKVNVAVRKLRRRVRQRRETGGGS